MDNSFLILGKVGRTYGIKGWFHLISFAETEANLLQQATWYLKDHNQWQAFELEAQRPHGDGYIAKLKGYDTPEATRLLTNREIGIPRTELLDLPEDEYYWSDLVGLEVYTVEDVHLGKVTQLLATGANDVVCVQGERERMIPYIDSVIKEVDLEHKRLVVDWDPEF
ncbi:MAG TPA: ribosome maturation factor RimM [Coxiellaceae bacterium]|nr:ribosome maturation factor RimM [Coxiellaceae bacterium]